MDISPPLNPVAESAEEPPVWFVAGRRLVLGRRTWIMGIVNVTPDSFSDGGKWNSPERAIRHGLRLLEEGADILDIGGESTRPGAEAVPVEEELRRVLPVIRGLRAERPDALLSIDTSKCDVAREAMAAGANIVNDVTAGLGDAGMLRLAAETGAGLVLMHMRGNPRTMQNQPVYENVVEEVSSFLNDRLAAAIAAGASPEQVVVDPGIGFGKTLEHNLALVAGIPRLMRLGRPVLMGVSRKRWLGEITGRGVEDRLAASLGGLAACVARGAQIIRVHDVKESCDVARVMDNVARLSRPYS